MEVIVDKNVEKDEVNEISKQVELMIILGNKKSLKTNELYEVAAKCCRNAIIVEDMKDLYLNYIGRFKKVGVIVEKSISKDIADEIIKILKNTDTEGYMYEFSR